MNWKTSKRQAMLKKRLIDSSHIYWYTSHQLDRMLLKMLHKNGIYTPDDLHKWKEQINTKADQIVPAGRRNSASDQLNQALINLRLAVAQLKRAIDERYLKNGR